MLGRRGTFTGANVFLSRNLVPPEAFDAIHDALRLNGAQVFLCCDPSRTAPNDYHVISSPDHEKFEDLKGKGCNLVGPQCILSCAKEHRMLPKHGFTCCLAMDGVKILASGFDKDEKAMIEKMVTAMGGVLQAKTSMDVNFVVVKNVLAAKYKWALHVLKKPIVNMRWLCQCWIEHRVVPQESYRILPFAGLTICVTRIPADERKEIERLITQNGGQYSADLTKKCSHLISDAPTGDKYVVAQRWGHIHIVSRKWIDQSLSRRACLDERLYPVNEISTASNDAKILQKEQSFQDASNVTSQLVPPTNLEDLETASSQYLSVSESYAIKHEVGEGYSAKINEKDIETNSEQLKETPKFDCPVAEDSEEDDLYLSSCRIFLAGFEEKELKRLVNIIRRGGGTRHMLLSEKLTHIILGSPSEIEKKEVRRLAVWGVINVVTATWLEECDRAKKELPVAPRHIFSALMVSKDSTQSSMEPHVAEDSIKKVENIRTASIAIIGAVKKLSDEKQRANECCSKNNDFNEIVKKFNRSSQHSTMNANHIHKSKLLSISSNGASSNDKATFKEKSFCFSSSFPLEPRAEVIEWIEGGGGIILDSLEKNADFIIESHGLSQAAPASISQSTSVTTHWIKSSLEECCIQDVASHILYSPLHCHIPLPGFEDLRFCVSQYEGKERILLRNLCFVLGAKFTEKLTKKVTHLLCKFMNGPKYEAACRKGIKTVTAEWIRECVSQDKLVPLESFQPRPVTLQDKEAGLCTVSQYPTQAAHMISFASQSQTQPHEMIQISRINSAISSNSKKPEDSNSYKKWLKSSERDKNADASKRNNLIEVCRKACEIVLDSKDAKKHDDLSPDGKRLKSLKWDEKADSSKRNKIIEVRREDCKTIPNVADAERHKDSSTDKWNENSDLSKRNKIIEVCQEGCKSVPDVSHADKPEESSSHKKRLKISEWDGNADTSKRNKIVEVRREDCKAVPDVADAIEDLLAQTDKIQDPNSPVISENERSMYAPNHPISGQNQVNSNITIGASSHSSIRPEKQESTSHTANQARKSGPFDAFSETQTDSQVVGYEEDLSGRQKIIERVRSQSLTLTPDTTLTMAFEAC